MLVNFTHNMNETMATLSILEASPFQFYLTGSRFFGNYHDKSDYDFFAQYNAQIYSWLKANKFHRETKYDSAEYISAIQGLAEIFRRGDVHIQLVEDLELKMITQEMIRMGPEVMLLTNKTRAKHIWDKYTRHVSSVLTVKRKMT